MQGTIFISLRDIGVGGSENDNFHLLYAMKISLHRGVGGSKQVETPLLNINIKIVPNVTVVL